MKDAMKAMALANANMMAAITMNSDQTKVLTGRVGDIGRKTDRTIEALEKHGMVFQPDAPAPTTAPAATPAPPGGGAKPPAQNSWMTATSGGGRGGGGGKKRPGRGMGGAVSEDYDGLDDDDDEEHTVPLSIAARTRSSISRRVEAARLLISGAGSTDGLAAIDTDPRESTVGTEHGWAEYP